MAVLMRSGDIWLSVASQIRVLLHLVPREQSSSREVVLEMAFAELSLGHRNSSNGGLKCLRRHNTSREQVVQLLLLLNKLGTQRNGLSFHCVE